ncbi:MAG: hypothetical protein FD181_985 [Prolixibacteraceae bacterium]|nr:MAG: hypothetical protein FD181_985 [Prolixibacteraceae bacterium]
MIERLLENIIKEKIGRKAIIILGARQTGKTTLIKKILKESKNHAILLNADLPTVQQQLQNPSVSGLKQIFGLAKLVFIDEAQRISNIGITLKIIIDELEDIQLVVTGSSALELSNSINEPLTGRKLEYRLFPISWQELISYSGYLDALSQLEQRIIFGMYPDVINNMGNEREILANLSESYLYKDIIAFQQVRKPEFVQKLLQALAFQTGKEVSYNELATLLQIDRKTIINYIDLLEKSFIIFRLPAFSRNLRNELTSKIKIYFNDTGVRNALIEDFRPLGLRPDKGELWENFLISERLKTNHYGRRFVKTYFWKTHQKQEIDFIEESDGQIKAFEFKWKVKANMRFPLTFNEAYKDATMQLISTENFNQFITNE